METIKLFSLIAFFSMAIGATQAQCVAGEIEVEFSITTDNWGYEAYWELVPEGNGCGDGTIESGGNNAVGCDGGGDQNVQSGGYNNNDVIVEGPWCLATGETYTIHYVDDWGDGGVELTVLIGGIVTEVFEGSDDGNVWSFDVVEPPALDAAVLDIFSYAYTSNNYEPLTGLYSNQGTATITELELQYVLNGASPWTQTFTGLDIESNQTAEFTFTNMMLLSSGLNDVEVSVVSVNGGTDEVSANDSSSKDIELGPGIPNVIDGYLDIDATATIINSPNDGVDTPRDLDFHPTLTRFELWVLNKGTENSGGSTVRFENVGFGDQDSEYEQDGNAWHFMSLPTALAFGENGNFATSPGVYDANHDGGGPFTGPSLWSSVDEIYAEPSGGNGSHLDMLHASPRAQGIAHEVGNAYWVVDGENQDIVRYDFADDHGPGNSYHGDAIIHRYADFEIERDPADHIVSHCVLDKTTGWLYVVDHGNARVLRMDINTGSFDGVPSFGPFEDIQEYQYVSGYDYEVIVDQDLVEPAGIDIIGNRLLVSDHATGEVIAYDLDDSFTELGRIEGAGQGIMGIKVGPWGRVWYVNATTDEVGVLEGNALLIDAVQENLELNLFPNPATDQIRLNLNIPTGQASIQIVSMTGALVESTTMPAMGGMTLSTENYQSGLYIVNLIHNGQLVSRTKFVKL
jgi:hypothetical protein